MTIEPADRGLADRGPGEDVAFDVVVAGSGAAGMTAALTAAHLGLSVLVTARPCSAWSWR